MDKNDKTLDDKLSKAAAEKLKVLAKEFMEARDYMDAVLPTCPIFYSCPNVEPMSGLSERCSNYGTQSCLYTNGDVQID